MRRRDDHLFKIAVTLGVILFVLIAVMVFTLNPGLSSLLPFANKPEPLESAVFDVNDVVNGGLEDIKNRIGEPLDEKPATFSATAKTWRQTYKTGKNEMVVTYNISDDKPQSFFVATDDPSGRTKDKERLLKLAGVEEKNSEYDVVFVKTAEDPNYFTGIKIIPK